ncbi:MAG TPA: ornithine carbamoyltransferase [Alphaproteobacteria bacterium]|nr:ornithine carbamoyltransferase [Alphaproteobacteria bacterium]
MNKKNVRHFLDLSDFSADTLMTILRRAQALKRARCLRGDLRGKSLALIFEKPSTRTRVSFEVAMHELGGHALALTGKEMQLGHGESLGDTAQVLGRFVHGLMVRTFAHANLLELAQHSPIPVINGLTDFSHPCQVMADLLTVLERFGVLKNRRIVWYGDGDNNVLTSWIQAATLFDLPLTICCPKELAPKPDVLPSSDKIILSHDPDTAISGADVVLTDTWISMHNSDAERRRALLAPYQINAARMAQAAKKAIFMHCLPAHRGEEVTDEVIDGKQSAVWVEAENRLHVQKAILLWCFAKMGL